ncbi:hypothetical protein ABKV19_022928 [Rosa sericea]
MPCLISHNYPLAPFQASPQILLHYLWLQSFCQSIQAGQSAVIRTLLYPNATQMVPPYNITVRQFTKAISQLTNNLGKCGIKSESILLANTTLGAENRTTSNVLSADANSLSYARTEPEILRIVYGTGNENLPGGFFSQRCQRQNCKEPAG